jgi:hypothetical protein
MGNFSAGNIHGGLIADDLPEGAGGNDEELISVLKLHLVNVGCGIHSGEEVVVTESWLRNEDHEEKGNMKEKEKGRGRERNRIRRKIGKEGKKAKRRERERERERRRRRRKE